VRIRSRSSGVSGGGGGGDDGDASTIEPCQSRAARTSSREARDPILGEQLLFLEPAHLGLLGGGQGASALEGLHGFIEAAVFGVQLVEESLVRGAHDFSTCIRQALLR
jgi:hypothetical protein